MMTRIHDKPSVSGTNRKWYSAVTANCSRERSTSSAVGIGFPGRRGRGHEPLGDTVRHETHVLRYRSAEEEQPEEAEPRHLEHENERDVARQRRQSLPAGTIDGQDGSHGRWAPPSDSGDDRSL